ncbi:MarR family winged helix-turn-helix transcriptional regulator [Niallia sp. NCCP-28]|uniref:MarR family winged helix-turn-helix transcriptional regulator n=1 Tax=Niallia sp. NCCP-28 TaxID=2934712 RepID=UPI00207E2A6D|nr:MarR family transcriptional regulator [Niallia sp. NCCP-28]GKU81748.1 hypothetical protein NCCP28_11440 [Niallia sp. NCCP-28]
MDNSLLFRQFVKFTASVHEVTHQLTKNNRPTDITSVQYSIMEHIYVNQSATLSEISDCLYISMPNTSREIKKLTEKGLLKKVENKDDRRKQSISFTIEGQKKLETVFAGIEANFHSRIKDLPDHELEKVREAIDLLEKYIF